MKAICTFLLLFAVSWPIAADTAKPQTAIVIRARELPDPNFKDSVVVVMNNVAPGPFGLIVNRPTRIAVSQLFPEIRGLAGLDDKVYFGGPVAITRLLFLFRANAPPADAVKVIDDVYLSGDLELLRRLLERETPMAGLRIFIGYSGWAPGQLEDEIARGHWSLAPAQSGVIFGRKSEHPWPEPDVNADEQHT